MSKKIPSVAFKIAPQKATYWMALSASEVAPLTLAGAGSAYDAMLTSAPDVVLAAMNSKQVARCIEESRRRAEDDETLTWAQHLVLVVQQAMAKSLGAMVSDPRANAPARATLQ